MGKILTVITYLVCIIFAGRAALHVFFWFKAGKGTSAGRNAGKMSASTAGALLSDIFLFRRLFKTNRLLWLASWTFHVSFALVMVRHLRYFMYPVPDFIVSMQNAGVCAGYLLPASLLLILVIRIAGNHNRYVSVYNYFLVITLCLTGLTGLFLRLSNRVSIVDVKAFTLGIVTLSPDTMPDSILFTLHFLLALILIPFLPFHLIAAPITTMEARKRDEGLHMVLHEK